MEPDMPIIRRSIEAGREVRSIPVGIFASVCTVLLSVIGAQWTWLTSAKVERVAVVAEFEKTLHASEAIMVQRLIGIETTQSTHGVRILELERQVNKNTGIIERMRDK